MLFSDTVIASEEPVVMQKSYCLCRGSILPTCENPIPRQTTQVSLKKLPTDSDGNKIIWVWSSVVVPENIKVMYVFYSQNTKLPWSETIHFDWTDRAWSVLNEVKNTVIGVLRAIYSSDDSLHNLQALGFMAKPNSLNRWPVNFKVSPGTYWFEIQDLNGKVIKGGEKLEITIVE